MTLNEFIISIKNDFSKLETIYRGLVITELSLPNFSKNTSRDYNSNYYVDAYNNKQNIKLLIPISVLNTAIQLGHNVNENVSVDVTIDIISVDFKSTILIKISKIIESGISEQIIFLRGLSEYCNTNKLFDRTKKPMPSLIKKIALITTINTNTEKDIVSNLDYKNEVVSCKVNPTSNDIAKQILYCQNLDFDMIILYRGGHEDQSMNIYSDIPVLNAIHNSKHHVGVALGHEIDTPFVYKIADSNYSTPTNLAQIVNEINTSKLNEFNAVVSKFSNYFKNNVFSNKLNNILLLNTERINRFTNDIVNKKAHILSSLHFNINNIANKSIHSTDIKTKDVYSNCENKSALLINMFRNKLLLRNEKINALYEKTIERNKIVLSSTFTNINRNSSSSIADLKLNISNINNNLITTSNALIDRKSNELLSTYSSIESILNKIERDISNRKIKRQRVVFAIIVVIIIAVSILIYK